MAAINWTLARVAWAAFRAASTTLVLIMFLTGSGRLTATAATSPAPRQLPLAASVADVMRASVQIPADGIWAVQFNDALSEKEWLLADQDAVNVTASASLMSIGGTGKQDQAWVSNADWQAWALDIQKTGLLIRAAVKDKDQKKFSDAADHLTEVCTACHAKYRPDKPSDGVVRYPFYPHRVLEK